MTLDHIERHVLAELLAFQGLEVSTPKTADPSIGIRGALSDKKAQVEKLSNLIEQTDERTARNLLGRLKRFEEEVDELETSLRNVVAPKVRADTIASALKAAVKLYTEHEKAEMTSEEQSCD